jgi:hypothetical protein
MVIATGITKFNNFITNNYMNGFGFFQESLGLGLIFFFKHKIPWF